MDTELLEATLAEQVDPQRITQLTLDMVRIPSPPGEERAVSEFYADVLRDAGLEVELDYEFPSSPSVVAWLRGSGREHYASVRRPHGYSRLAGPGAAI